MLDPSLLAMKRVLDGLLERHHLPLGQGLGERFLAEDEARYAEVGLDALPLDGGATSRVTDDPRRRPAQPTRSSVSSPTSL